jgi:hypothetical protein
MSAAFGLPRLIDELARGRLRMEGRADELLVPDPSDCPKLKALAEAMGVSVPVYLIISEGSKFLFPPRNLVPVP